MKAQELWHITTSDTQVKETSIANDDSKLTIEAKYSFISQGTEKLVRRVNVPEELQSSMRVPYMKGSFELPLNYGYAIVGQVVEGPKAWENRYIHCMHPHASYFQITAADAYDLGESISSRHSLIGNLETAINGVWDSNMTKGARILIVGLGSIGLLTGLVAEKLFQAEVYFLEQNPERKTWAETKGWSALKVPDHVDFAFHTTATSAGLQSAIDALKTEGTVVELSWYGKRKVEINLGGSFHIQRKKIIASQVSTIPPLRQVDWDFKKRKDLAKELALELEIPEPVLISLKQAADWFNGDWKTDSSLLMIDYSL